MHSPTCASLINVNTKEKTFNGALTMLQCKLVAGVRFVNNYVDFWH